MIDYIAIALHLIVLAVCASTFWKAAMMEDAPGYTLGFVWSGLSIALFLIAWLVLGWGWMGLVLCQISLLLAIGVLRAIKYTHETRRPKA